MKPLLTLLSDAQHVLSELKRGIEATPNIKYAQMFNDLNMTVDRLKKEVTSANKSRGQYRSLYEKKVKDCRRLGHLINNECRRYKELEQKMFDLERENILLRVNKGPDHE